MPGSHINQSPAILSPSPALLPLPTQSVPSHHNNRPTFHKPPLKSYSRNTRTTNSQQYRDTTLSSKQSDIDYINLNADPEQGKSENKEENKEQSNNYEEQNTEQSSNSKTYSSPSEQSTVTPPTSNPSSPEKKTPNSPLIKDLPPPSAKLKPIGLLTPPPRPQWPLPSSTPTVIVPPPLISPTAPTTPKNALLPTPPLPSLSARSGLLNNPQPYPAQQQVHSPSILPLPSPASYFDQSQTYSQYTQPQQYNNQPQQYSQSQQYNQSQQYSQSQQYNQTQYTTQSDQSYSHQQYNSQYTNNPSYSSSEYYSSGDYPSSSSYYDPYSSQYQSSTFEQQQYTGHYLSQ